MKVATILKDIKNMTTDIKTVSQSSTQGEQDMYD